METKAELDIRVSGMPSEDIKRQVLIERPDALFRIVSVGDNPWLVIEYCHWQVSVGKVGTVLCFNVRDTNTKRAPKPGIHHDTVKMLVADIMYQTREPDWPE